MNIWTRAEFSKEQRRIFGEIYSRSLLEFPSLLFGSTFAKSFNNWKKSEYKCVYRFSLVSIVIYHYIQAKIIAIDT